MWFARAGTASLMSKFALAVAPLANLNCSNYTSHMISFAKIVLFKRETSGSEIKKNHINLKLDKLSVILL